MPEFDLGAIREVPGALTGMIKRPDRPVHPSGLFVNLFQLWIGPPKQHAFRELLIISCVLGPMPKDARGFPPTACATVEDFLEWALKENALRPGLWPPDRTIRLSLS